MILVPPSGPCPARIAIVGEAPGADEERIGRPFVGASGQLLDELLHNAGILRTQCFVTNVIKTRPPDNDLDHFFLHNPGPSKRKELSALEWVDIRGSLIHPGVADHPRILDKELAEVKPDLTICLGNLALWALTRRWGISDWRGSTIPAGGEKRFILPTLHPAAVFRAWGWRSYISLDLERAARVLGEGGLTVPGWRFVVRPTLDTLQDVFAQLLSRLALGPMPLVCDIETRGHQIDCIGFAWSRLDALCVPLWSRDRPNYWDSETEVWIVQQFRNILTHPNTRAIFQNAAYDCQYIRRGWGFLPRLAFDTMLGHHVLWPGTEKDLATLSSLYCDYHCFWKHESAEADEKKDDLGRWVYNCRDCVATYEVAEALIPNIIEEGLAGPALFQHRRWHLTMGAMERGVRPDCGIKEHLSRELKGEIDARQKRLDFVLRQEINPRSSPQLKTLFYQDFGEKPIKVRKGKEWVVSCNEEALAQLGNRNPILLPIVKWILEIRSLGVLRSTFVEMRLDIDGRVRCSYNVGGTETLRLASSKNAFGSGTNLQNIPRNEPIESDEIQLDLPTTELRKMFLFDEGMEGFDMDLSGADLRVVVWESDESEMKSMFAAGLTPYLEIAKEFYHDDGIVKGSSRYENFKRFCHGSNYLGSPDGLAKRIGISVSQARRTQDWYFRRFRRIRDWQNRIKAELASTRTVRNAFGYRRYYFDRIDSSVHHKAAAWIPQSTIGLLIDHIWDELERTEPDIQILLQCHDSLVGQYPRDRGEYYRRRIKEIAAGVAVPYSVPLVIPIGLKVSDHSWGECQ